METLFQIASGLFFGLVILLVTIQLSEGEADLTESKKLGTWVLLLIAIVSISSCLWVPFLASYRPFIATVALTIVVLTIPSARASAKQLSGWESSFHSYEDSSKDLDWQIAAQARLFLAQPVSSEWEKEKQLNAFSDKIAASRDQQLTDEWNGIKMTLAGVLTAAEQLKRDHAAMSQQLADSKLPFFATSDIRDRLQKQVEAATVLHRESNHRTKSFQTLGISVIIVGLLLVVAGATYSLISGKGLQELTYLAPIVGAIFNVVGVGLILFHKTASRTAMAYFDRKEKLQNCLIALELLTNPVMNETRSATITDFVRSLFPDRVPVPSSTELIQRNSGAGPADAKK